VYKHKHSFSLAMENNFVLIYFSSFVYFLGKSAKTFKKKDIHILHKLLAYHFMFACTYWMKIYCSLLKLNSLLFLDCIVRKWGTYNNNASHTSHISIIKMLHLIDLVAKEWYITVLNILCNIVYNNRHKNIENVDCNSHEFIRSFLTV